MIVYDYIHSICYWDGNERIICLKTQIEKLISTKHSSKKDFKILCIISIRSNNKYVIDKSPYELLKDMSTDNLDIEIIYNFNWGGTVGTLWDTYKYLTINNISSYIIGTWEDDAIFKHDLWFDVVEELLLKDYIYIGSLHETHNIINQKKYSELNYKFNYTADIVRVPGFEISQVFWVEDPYILFFKNLKIIEEKIGCFTRAKQGEEFIYGTHGIIHGEVGFPTRLVNAGFKIYGIPSSRRSQESFILFLDPFNELSKSGSKTYTNIEGYKNELKSQGII